MEWTLFGSRHTTLDRRIREDRVYKTRLLACQDEMKLHRCSPEPNKGGTTRKKEKIINNFSLAFKQTAGYYERKKQKKNI